MWTCGGTVQDGIGTLQAGTCIHIGIILGAAIGTATGTDIGTIRGGARQVGHGTAIGMIHGGAIFTTLYMRHGRDTDLREDRGIIRDTADPAGMSTTAREVPALHTMG